MKACQAAAAQMTAAGRRSSQYTRTFNIEETTDRVLVPSPTIVAECVGS